MIPGEATLPKPSDPGARLVDTSAGTIAISEEGPGGGWPVLCIHGIPGSRRDFRYLAPWLAESCRVVRVEMPGFGDSPPTRQARLAHWARVPIAVADVLGLSRVAVLGHSFGGGAALLAAAGGRERVGALVLLASMGTRRHRAFTLPTWMFGAAAAALRLPLAGRLVTVLVRGVYKRLGLPPPQSDDLTTISSHLRVLASVSFPALRRAALAVAVPALVVHGRDDRLVEPAIAREMAALLPRGELLELPSGGHHLQKTRAREVASAVLSFFERIPR